MQRAHWWRERGAFVDALFAKAAPAGEGDPGSGWVWLSEQESRETAERIEKEAAEEESCFQGWIASEAHEACREMLSGCVPLATRGELRADRIMSKLHRPTLFGDPSRPEQVYLALDE